MTFKGGQSLIISQNSMQRAVDIGSFKNAFTEQGDQLQGEVNSVLGFSNNARDLVHKGFWPLSLLRFHFDSSVTKTLPK